MAQKQEAEKLIRFIRPYQVKQLYKYRSVKSEGLEDIFRKRQIYLTDATKFNDPFECRPILKDHQSSFKRDKLLKQLAKNRYPDADKRSLKKLVKGKKHLLTDKDTRTKRYKRFVSTIGIYCLSEKNDDLLMWSHYSDSHRGLCLIFDATTEDTLFWEAFKVVYQEGYPTVNVMEIGKAEEFRNALLTKSKCWCYEEERRILKTKKEGGPGIYSFQPELLTGVVFGALMPKDDKEIITNWITDYPIEIIIHQALLNESKYQLDIVPHSEA